MLSLLQAYRGFAAVLVVLFHAEATANAKYGAASNLFTFGWSGVQFFFVLSGYVIWHVHAKDVGDPRVTGSYLTKRVLRIYPLYLLVTLALAPMWLMRDGYYGDPISLLMSMALIPQEHPPHLAVAWTLIHEMMFYVAFIAFLVRRAAGVVAFSLWAAFIVYANIVTDLAYPLNYIGSVNNLLFILGMLTAAAPPLGKAAFVGGNLLFLAAGIAVNMGAAGAFIVFAFGLASAAILSAARDLDRVLGHRAFTLLGDASYAIYLVHYPVIAMVHKVIDADIAVAAVISISAGLAVHGVIERPMQRWLRRR